MTSDSLCGWEYRKIMHISLSSMRFSALSETWGDTIFFSFTSLLIHIGGLNTLERMFSEYIRGSSGSGRKDTGNVWYPNLSNENHVHVIIFFELWYRSQVEVRLGVVKDKDNVLARKDLQSYSWYPPTSFRRHNTRHTRAHPSVPVPRVVMILVQSRLQ